MKRLLPFLVLVKVCCHFRQQTMMKTGLKRPEITVIPCFASFLVMSGMESCLFTVQGIVHGGLFQPNAGKQMDLCLRLECRELFKSSIEKKHIRTIITV